MNPTFTIYTGPMFSAKTTSLLSILDRYKYQGKKIIVFKPKLDYRYNVDNISTHGGGTFPAVCIASGSDVLEKIAEADVNPQIVAVDEARRPAGHLRGDLGAVGVDQPDAVVPAAIPDHRVLRRADVGDPAGTGPHCVRRHPGDRHGLWAGGFPGRRRTAGTPGRVRQDPARTVTCAAS